MIFSFFFFNDTATTEIYTLSLHDALPILMLANNETGAVQPVKQAAEIIHSAGGLDDLDRKSTRLNSSHQIISYAVFCLKKKNNYRHPTQRHSYRFFDRFSTRTICITQANR